MTLNRTAIFFIAFLVITGIAFHYFNYSDIFTDKFNFTNSTTTANFSIPYNSKIGQLLVNEVRPTKIPTLGIWGDVMLARNVELLSNSDSSYAFSEIKDSFLKNDFNLINFEGTIPDIHYRTPSLVMRFSVTEEMLGKLSEMNVTHSSLANNHGVDFGTAAYQNTRQKLSERNIVAFGHPSKVDHNSIVYIDLDGYRLGILAVHTLFSIPTDDELESVFKILRDTSDIQIAYIHWGNEYVPIHDQSQSIFATKLVSLGADVIIGHHPHVAQDIELIGGVPVFYSLGNTIFDQYFSTAVQEGYSLALSIDENSLKFELIPITSIDKHSQPRPMTDDEKIIFLTDLANKSERSLSEDIKQGKLIFPIKLATSTQISIISR